MAMTFDPKSEAENSGDSTRTMEVRLSMPQPWTHYFEVQMMLEGIKASDLDFVMPAWTPGSYVIREFARNVQNFAAADASGKPLPWHKTSKAKWCVHSGGSEKVVLNYRVYAFEPTVRTSFLDDSHGYVNGASLFFYLEGFWKIAYRLTIIPYGGWARVSTSLEKVEGLENTFFAPDYDVLVDSPIEIGNQNILEFEVGNRPHLVSIYGEGNYEAERVRSDLKKIVETGAEIVGEIPYRQYTFLLHLTKEGIGGLEHAASTSLQVCRWCFQPEESYRKFLRLAAHEYFHVWNGKCIRPDSLGPFDYDEENYTRLLWITEGFTDYYEGLILRRAGLISPEKLLEDLSRSIQNYLEVPGRLVESVAEASFDAWIKQYRQDAHTPNATISYYLKGHLIGLVLDLEIRRRTGNRSMDDVLRFLYQKYYRELARGFSEVEFRAACGVVTGSSLDEILDRYAGGTEEMDLARYLAYAGIQLTPAGGEKNHKPKCYLGVSLQNIDGKPMVVGVPTGTPAYDQGLNVNDEILGMDGFRVNMETLQQRIAEKPPGTTIDLLIARADRLRTISIRLGERTARELKLEKMKDPTPQQKGLFESWLCAPWDSD
jgi:predicted metalloprotease with PDZ domain